jgi:ribosomal protein S18 acetylase RimI-like enzyme
VFRVRTYAEDDRAIALVTSRGHRDVRHFLTMRIDLDETPEPPTWPRGIVVDTFEPEDERAFHSALGEAFAQEWGVVQTEFDEWRRLRLEDPDFDPTLWFVARDGGELAAGARCELLFDGGWIAAIGVRPAWRRRGIGRALLLHAFAEFRRRGKTVVRLGVDAENPTGAAHLYEGAGMTVEFEDVVYEKELSRSG